MAKMNDARKRINITLPDNTIALIDRVTDNRSQLIDVAIHHYIKDRSRENVRKHLEDGYISRAKQNLQLAGEWFPLEEEIWQGNTL